MKAQVIKCIKQENYGYNSCIFYFELFINKKTDLTFAADDIIDIRKVKND